MDSMQDTKNQDAMNQAVIAMRKLARIAEKKRELQAVRSLFGAKQRRLQIAALEEGARDVTNTAIVQLSMGQASAVVDENNYKNYASQVAGAYAMYEQSCRYGGELFGGCIDTRAAFIGGEGVSFTTKNKKAEKFLKQFIEDNELNGAKLMEHIVTSELEGKCLLTLSIQTRDTGLIQDKGEKYVSLDSVKWVKRKYRISRDGDRLEKITYRENAVDQADKTYNPKETILVQTGRACWNDPDATPTRMHKALTNFENFSRATYDLRKNTHLFSKVVPIFKTQDKQDADIVKNLLEEDNWELGEGYAGPADPSLLEPTGAASGAILKDVELNLKICSHSSGIPVHWMAWPELMSNRATADSLMEVANASSKKERLCWERGLMEVFQKACIYAMDKAKILDAGSYPDDLVVRLPFVSLALLKQIVEIWLPLKEAKIISRHTYVTLLPRSIQDDVEQKLIEKEEKEAAKKSPMRNGAIDDALKNIRKGEDDEGNEGMPDLDGDAGPGERGTDIGIGSKDQGRNGGQA